MDFSLNRRVKKARQMFGLIRRGFSKLLPLSSGCISGIEAKLREVNDRLIKLIAAMFPVNEDWMRMGNGIMFGRKDTDEKAVCTEALFNDLPLHYQKVIFGTIELLRKASEEKISKPENNPIKNVRFFRFVNLTDEKYVLFFVPHFYRTKNSCAIF